MNQLMNTQRISGFLLALLAALAAISCSTSAAAGGGTVIRMQLSHTDAGRGLAPRELLRRMALRSKARAARLLLSSGASSSPPATSAPVTPGQGAPWATEYLVSFAIGTPPQPVKLTLDTGSDLVWTQCQPCVACYDQALPYFDMPSSTTFVPVPCNSSTCQQQLPWPPSCSGGGGGTGTGTGTSATKADWGGNINNQTCGYTYSYVDLSATNGVLAADTFTFADGGGGGGAAVDGMAFGCGFDNQGLLDFNSSGTGVAGFGRGALSLPSQLGVDNFSYCFTDIAGSTPSSVLLGLPAANLYGGGGGGGDATTVQTTPLNTTSTLYYYLNLQSITVGSTTLQVPASTFALNADGVTGGTVIDSGTSITLLPPRVYGLLRDAFAAELKTTPVAVASLPDVLCFPASATATTAMPRLQLRFDGATLDLPPENYVFPLDDDDASCIAIGSSGGDITVIGNYQQQKMHVLYDLAGNTISFVVPAQCDVVSSTASRRAVLHACCGWAYSTLWSVALLFVLGKLF